LYLHSRSNQSKKVFLIFIFFFYYFFIIRTKFTQQVKIKCFIWGVSDKVEGYALNTFLGNAERGRKIMNGAVERIPFILQGFPNDETLLEKIENLKQYQTKIKEEKN
jgi:hypothetical protein